MRLLGGIEPKIRQRDVKIALIVWTLLHRPFVVATGLTAVLQRPVPEVVETLDTATECRIRDQPLVVQFKDVWVLSDAALRVVDVPSRRALLRRRGVLAYRRPDHGEHVARMWLACHERYTTGDHARLTGLSVSGARKQLDNLADDGIVERGEERGRNAHYIAGPALRSRVATPTGTGSTDGTQGAA